MATNESISGLIIGAETGRPLAGLHVEAWDRDRRWDTALGAADTDATGAFTIALDARRAEEVRSSRPDIYFKVFRNKKLVANTRSQVLWNVAQRETRVIVPVREGDADGAATLTVSGVITTETGAPLAEVRVEAWNMELGGQTLLARGAPDDKGRYSLHYDAAALGEQQRADLSVRVIDPHGNGAEVARAATVYQADPQAEVNVTVKAASVKRPSEYQRLLGATAPILGQKPLGALDAQGVEFAANRAGWDARTVAMAAQAQQLSNQTKIPAEHYYAILRAGVPGTLNEVHRLSDATIEQTLKLAIAGGVIADDHPIADTLKIHDAQAMTALQHYAPKAAVSSLSDMLAVSLDATRSAAFLEAYRSTADKPAELWNTLAARGFDAATIARLRTDGKLGFLTRQNAPLVARLKSDAKVERVEDLARAGLYKADAWKPLIGNAVPEGMTADAYAAGLAAQVNLSWPTLVTAEMVRRREIPVDAQSEGEGEVAAFLRAGHPTFTLGVDPVKRWDGYGNLSKRGQDGARLVERIFQLTPSNDSMVKLYQRGLHSARDIVADSRKLFLEKHGDALGGEAPLIYQKAQEIHSQVLNLTTMYLSYRGAPNVYAMTGQKTKQADAAASDAPSSPTLESLFQSMDYCACDECKSVFGAAAYFVDLLRFIDVAPEAPHAVKPVDVLLGRRPDLQDLLLTCENTNIALPYVDIVNEILEHWILNGNLAAFHGFNMRENSDTADLLADPEHVSAAAYDLTKQQVFPHPLPFDMPLAALRLLMQAWGTTLPDALRIFGSAASARREVLALNQSELRILTDTTFKALPEYFGEPAASTIDQLNLAVAAGKTFCRRTEIDYGDLVTILSARFINPGAPLVPLLTQLQISLQQLQTWYDGTLDDAGLRALLPATLDATPYGGDVLPWLRANQALIMGLITLTDVSAEAAECNFADVELRFALPDAANNRLTDLAYYKLLRFIRLWRKLGYTIDLTDQIVTTFLGVAPDALTMANLDATFTALVARIANFSTLMAQRSVAAERIPDWLALWDTTQTAALRHERLAHLVRIGTTDLEHFIEITGLDPLADDLAGDSPSILAFLDAWAALKSVGVKVVDVDYLLRSRDDSGALGPSKASLLRDLKALRDGLDAIDVDLGAPPANADLAWARSKLALVYDGAVVDRFIALISGTALFEVPLATVEESLPLKLTAADPHLGFRPVDKVLTHAGILDAATATALSTAADSLTLADVNVIQTAGDLATYVAAFKTAVAAMAAAGVTALDQLDSDYHELKVAYDAVAGIADPAAQAAALIVEILPALRTSLHQLSLRTTLASQLKLDQPVVDVLCDGPAIVHAVSDASAGVLRDLEQLDGTVTLDANGTYALHVDPPATDDYIVYVAAPAGTTVTMSIDGAPVIPATAVGAIGEVSTAAALPLKAGVLSSLLLTLAGLPAAAKAELRWRTNGMAKAPLPQSRLWDDARIADAGASLIRLRKAALVLDKVPLTPRALRHLAAVNVDTRGFFNALDVDGTITTASLNAQWVRLYWLSWFADLAAGDDTWIDLLEQPGLLTPKGKLVLAANLGCPDQDLTDVVAHFALTLPDLSALHLLRKVKEALDFVAATSQTAADLMTWTVDAPDATLIATIKGSIRARNDPTSWRTTLQGVNDALRNQRRDALCAFILHHAPPTAEIDTADKLYEYFLLDVQMDACMLTSRIRLALSTVQLFITRCLMNLEPDVSPASVDADQWQWMKRYRVWEANRRIFVYPENWLAPELRDGKSSFFTELEAELLKSDITDDLAESAYLDYLKKLDEVARLEILGCYLQQRDPSDPQRDVLHVFGRTNGNTHQYYYRRLDEGSWTPWEKMSLHIEGDLIFPVIWKSQLFVFWLSPVHKPQGGDSTQTPTQMSTAAWGTSAKVNAEVNLVWGEYYQGKWTSPKSTELTQPLVLTGLDKYEPEKVVLSARTFRPSPDVSERLVIGLAYLGSPAQSWAATFTSKNAPPLLSRGLGWELFFFDIFQYEMLWAPAGTPSTLDNNRLREPNKIWKVRIDQPTGALSSTLDETLLTKTGPLGDGFRVRPVMHPISNQWEAPLFYDDEHSIFYVKPNEHVDLVAVYDGYYWLDVVALVPLPSQIKIPPLYEQPVIVDPLGPVEKSPMQTVINPNFQRAINSSAVFEYAGTQFNARGIAGAVNAGAVP